MLTNIKYLLCTIIVLVVIVALADQYLKYQRISILSKIDQKTIVEGIKEAQKHKVVFVGITRDNAKDLKIVKKDIEAIGKYFQDYRGIFFENDSKDRTKRILKQWSTDNNKIKVISKDFGNKKRPNILFLANARNEYLKPLMSQPEYGDFDLVIMLDMDMSYGFDVRSIMNSISQIDKWDTICANGMMKNNRMYDTFAFRDQSSIKYAPHEIGGFPAYWNQVETNFKKFYHVNEAIVPVHSCFGGLAIYKKAALKNCKYDSIEDDCEHVYLHQCMRKKNNAKIFLNPSMVVFYSHYTL